MSNPLLEPIHGVSLYDYAGISAKMAAGISEDEIFKALGIEATIYQEASALWIARMQEDKTFGVSMEFGKCFGKVESHPKLGHLHPNVSQEGIENLEKLKTDRYFYEELCGARIAAYQYGLDGAQWIQDNFGINLGDFQAVAMHWMQVQNDQMAKGNHKYALEVATFQQEKQAEYAKKFAEEQGGNVADDIEF